MDGDPAEPLVHEAMVRWQVDRLFRSAVRDYRAAVRGSFIAVDLVARRPPRGGDARLELRRHGPLSLALLNDSLQRLGEPPVRSFREWGATSSPEFADLRVRYVHHATQAAAVDRTAGALAAAYGTGPNADLSLNRYRAAYLLASADYLARFGTVAGRRTADAILGQPPTRDDPRPSKLLSFDWAHAALDALQRHEARTLRSRRNNDIDCLEEGAIVRTATDQTGEVAK